MKWMLAAASFIVLLLSNMAACIGPNISQSSQQFDTTVEDEDTVAGIRLSYNH